MLLKKIFTFILTLIFLISSFLPYFNSPFSPKYVYAQSNCGNASSPNNQLAARVGGVALDQAATFLADMSDIVGAYYDNTLDRIVFVGKQNTSLPKFDKDDLAVAIKAVIFNNTLPAVSMEPDLNNPTGSYNIVYYYGGIEDTRFGQVLVDADFKMKKYEFGYDENKQPVTSSVSGYKSFFQRYLDKNPDFTAYPSSSSRFVLRPDIVSLKRDTASNSFVFDQVKMKIYTEPMQANNDPKYNEAATEFAAHHTQHYEDFAKETPSYTEAKQLGKIVAVIKWISDNDILTDFGWARDYTPKFIATPRTMAKIITPPSVQGAVMSGGVEYYTANNYLADDGASSALKTASESVGASKEDIHWTFTEGGQTYESVAVAADAFRSLGSYSTSVTDMAFPVAGDLTLAFLRSYSSFSGGQYGIGRGWNFYPAQLFDNLPDNPTWRSYCSGETKSHRYKLAFQGVNGLYETFTWSCSPTPGFKPDDPSYHAKVSDNDDRSLITVSLKDQTEYVFRDSFEGHTFRLEQIKDKNDNTISYDYDSTGKLVGISDNKNHTISLSYNSQNLISSIIDWSLRKVSFAYDAQGNLTSVVDPLGNTTTYSYNENFKLVSITNREGTKIIENSYTPKAKLATKTALGGVTNSYSYDDTNRIISITDNLGRSTKTKYDEKARVLEETDPLLKSIKYTYGAELAPLTITDKNNNTINNTYDANGNLKTVMFPDTKVITYEYDSKNRVTKIIDGRYGTPAKETLFTYDALGNLVEINESGRITKNTYDLSGELASSQDPLIHATSWTRDSLGNSLTETNAVGKIITFEYDSIGRLKKQTDPNGKIMSYEYDVNGNLISQTDALGTTIFAYDKENRLVKTTLPNNSATNFTYNLQGSLSSVIDAFNSTTTYGYDAYKNLTSAQDALERTTQFSHDQLNRQTQSTTPLGKVSKWEYDANGNIKMRTDANNKITLYSYDAFNRLTKIVFNDLKTVLYTYDNRGNLIKTVDPVGTTTYTYDIFDRLTSVKNPYGRNISYEYDSANNLRKITYPDSRAVSYTYDDANRLVSVSDWNGMVTSYTYHDNGLLSLRSSPNGILSTYAYDNSNRLSEIKHAKGALTVARFAYERDSVGNIAKAIEEGTFFPSPTPTPTVTPTPTPTSPVTPTPTPNLSPTPTAIPTPTLPPPSPTPTPTPLTSGADLVITEMTTTPTTPTAGSQFTITITLKNQGNLGTGFVIVKIPFYYDLSSPPTTQTPYSSYLLKSINLAAGAQTQINFSKTFSTSGSHTISAYVDPNNTIAETNDLNNSFGPQQVNVIAQAGNSLMQFANLPLFNKIKGVLSNVLRGSVYAQQQLPQFITLFGYDALSRIQTAGYPEDIHYKFLYDKVDNRTSMTIENKVGTASAAYTYDNDNQLVSVGTGTFTYDNNGNLITHTNSSGTASYTYNFDNRLVKYGAPSGSSASYTYDGNNNRIAKSVGFSTTRFVSDVSGELPRVIAETNSFNSITKSYIYGAGLISQGQTSISSRDYYLEDGLGNIRFVTDESGNKVRSTNFDPFGNYITAQGQSNIHMLFQGQQLDTESGLYYMRARHYDPTKGRFVSRDPVKGILENPQTQNPYSYALNNPVNNSDPSGEFVQGLAAGAAACVRAACADGDCTNEARLVANNAVSGVNLAKSLASQQQMGEVGKIIAGPGSNTVFRDAALIAQQYGGQAADWVKKTSSSFTASDGTTFQTHWVENIVTGIRILFKTVF